MNIKKIALIGAGGFGREVHKLIDEINFCNKSWEICGFFDEKIKIGTIINGIPVIGNDKDVLTQDNIKNFVIAITRPEILKRIGEILIKAGKFLPNIVHPNVNLDYDFNKIGFGNIFAHGSYLTRNITIGNLNIFNTRVTLGHDVVIGSYNIFLPNTQISGNVSVGENNIFGMNSSVLQGRRIGSNNIIGSHSFVVTNVNSGQNLFGIPAVKVT
jgi:sugar O-acyltransferase (sialic acid O-acetyltransferase NeuD family)